MSLTTLKTATTARHLVLRALAKASSGDEVSTIDGTTAGNFNTLQVGEAQAFSYFEPTLQSGDYVVSTHQKIQVDGQEVEKSDEQEFSVETPKYKLPDDAIKSFYPPSGYGAPVETLPHIVFKDPYLPWERPASTRIETTPVYKVPWMALIAFTEDELRLEPQHLEGHTGLFRNFTAEPNKPVPPIEQDPNLSVQIPLNQVLNLAGCQTPIKVAGHSTSKETSFSAIFLKPSLFNELFRNQSVNEGDQKSPDLSRYGYLSHVRRINAEGMAEAGVEDYVHYSLVLSHRTGPVNQKNPAPVVVHLVSLEGVEDMAWPIQDLAHFVAMSSLCSWTYMCLPPGSFDVKRMMRDLGTTRGALRGSLPSATDIGDNSSSQRVAKRISDGYTLTRYRTQTGETTAAIFRGALTPTFVPHPISKDWSMLSDCGMELQILDHQVGLIDITYYAAWQLGKTLAIADQAFNTALTKLRSQIHVKAMNQAKAKILIGEGVYISKDEAIKATAKIMEALDKLQGDGPNTDPGQQNLMYRWNCEVKDPVDLSLNNKKLENQYTRSALEVAKEFATSADPDNDDIYNELNQPTSSEWQLVLSWVLDKMFLSSIPSQYLVVDQGHLPPESLRFFHIDANWIDAFLDGALSVGNHLETRFDKVRFAIKRLINNYITTPLPATGRPPPIPSYGFFMRSDIVSHFPDLRVNAEFEPSRADPTVPSIMRQIILADGVLMCLVDASPFSNGPSRLTGLRFTQPSHQQSFEVGSHLEGQSLSTTYKRLYTWYDGSNRSDPLCPDGKLTLDESLKDKRSSIFAWGTSNEIRSLQFPAWSNKLLETLQNNMPSKDETFTSKVMTSALVGMQLTKPIVELFISTNEEIRSTRAGTEDLRTLWVPKLPPALKMTASLSAMTISSLEGQLEPPGSRTRLSAMPLHGEPPHQNPVRAPPVEIANAAMEMISLGPNSGPANTPAFLLQVFPVGEAVSSTADTRVVPMGNKQDLVFSVSLADPDLVGEFYINEIRIIVPMGPAGRKGRGTLLRDYRGPAPAMLSNLRFNVISSTAADYSYILFRLVPRTTAKLGIHFTKALEISFLLSLVDVNEYADERKKTYMYVTESYKDDHGNKIGPINREFMTVLEKRPPKAET